MTTLTNTHRVTTVDYCDCAALEGAEPIEQPWDLLVMVQAVIAVIACIVIVFGDEIAAWLRAVLVVAA